MKLSKLIIIFFLASFSLLNADEPNILKKIQDKDESAILEKLQINMEAIQWYSDFYKRFIPEIAKIIPVIKLEYPSLTPYDQSRADKKLDQAERLIVQATETIIFFNTCITLYTSYQNGDNTIPLTIIVELANTSIDKMDDFSRSTDEFFSR